MATWTNIFTAIPLVTEDHGLGFQRINETRAETLARFQPEHSVGDATTNSGYSADDGRHSSGSARAFVTDTIPTALLAPDGSTAASGPSGFSGTLARTTDEGRLWVDRSGSTNQLRFLHNDTDASELRWESPHTYYNHIINGSMQVWQRGGIGDTVTCGAGSETFTADRWYVDPTGAGVEVSRILSSTAWTIAPVLGIGPARYAMLLDADAGVSTIKIGYRIEDVDVHALTVDGEVGGDADVTLSFRLSQALADSRTVTPSITVNTADANNDFSAVTSYADGTSGPLTTLTANLEKQYSFTFDMNDIPDRTEPKGLEIELLLTIGGGTVTTGNIHLGNVLLESGSGQSKFLERPFQDELRACQRYFEKTFNYDTAPVEDAGFQGALATGVDGTTHIPIFSWRYQVSKAQVGASQTITTFNPGDTGSGCRDVTDGSNDTIDSVDDMGSSDTADPRGNFGTSIRGGIGQTGDVLMVHATCDAELI